MTKILSRNNKNISIEKLREIFGKAKNINEIFEIEQQEHLATAYHSLRLVGLIHMFLSIKMNINKSIPLNRQLEDAFISPDHSKFNNMAELITNLFKGALLHDIAKLSMKDIIDSDVSFKDLESSEQLLIREHAYLGAKITLEFSFNDQVCKFIKYHHTSINLVKDKILPLGFLELLNILEILDICDATIDKRRNYTKYLNYENRKIKNPTVREVFTYMLTNLHIKNSNGYYTVFEKEVTNKDAKILQKLAKEMLFHNSKIVNENSQFDVYENYLFSRKKEVFKILNLNY